MKFKEYLNEYVLPHNRKEYEFMLRGLLPLKPSSFESKRQKVYRIVGLQSPKNAKKYEGKKVEFSGFTKGSDSLAGGYFSGNSIMYELEADVVFGMSKDFFSDVDRNGYKWLNDEDFMYYILKEMKKYYKKNEDDPLDSRSYDIDYQMAIYLEKSGKRKQKFIKWYFDEAKKFLDNPKNIEKIIKNQTEGSDYTHDEVIFNNYKIIGAYVIGPRMLKSKTKYDLDVVEYNITSVLDAYDTLNEAKIKYLGTILEIDIKKIDLEKGKEAKDLAFFPKYETIRKYI